MAAKLDRKNWAKAVKTHRRSAQKQSFVEQVKQQKAQPQKRLSSMDWRKRLTMERLKKSGGGRHRALVHPGRSRKKVRKTGGMLKSNSRPSQKTLSEPQREALIKTGDQISKKGINASNWAYDHRKVVAERRNRAAQVMVSSGGKKGINAVKWHYDHQKAQASEKMKAIKSGRPKTHTSVEKKRTQQQAITKHQPKQPTQPKQPRQKPPQRASVQKRVK